MHPTFGSYDRRLLDGRPETAHRFYTLSGVADPLLTRSSKEKSLARWNNYRRGVFHLNISTVTRSHNNDYEFTVRSTSYRLGITSILGYLFPVI
jgi:hypothetical protein